MFKKNAEMGKLAEERGSEESMKGLRGSKKRKKSKRKMAGRK